MHPLEQIGAVPGEGVELLLLSPADALLGRASWLGKVRKLRSIAGMDGAVLRQLVLGLGRLGGGG